MFQVRVSLSGREHPLLLDLPSDDPTLSDLEAAIFDACDTNMYFTRATHNLRVIVAGKVLYGSSTPLSTCCVSNGTLVHCAVSDLEYLPSLNFRGAGYIQRQRSRLSSSFAPEYGEQEQGIAADEVSQIGTHEESSGIRENIPSYTILDARVESEPTFDQLREAVLLGPVTDWFWGAMIGLLLGFIMLLLSLDKSIVTSRNWRKGVKFGVICNVLFGAVILMQDGLGKSSLM
jgi:DUF2407 C-terminal domain